MLLKRVQLSNFRQYEHLDINFMDGVTAIVGHNGSGKSTILEAILWCLFGIRAARTSKEGIKRQTASEADDCRVTVSFEIAEAEYALERQLVGKTNRSEARLTKQGSLDAVSTREVDNYIIRLIGLDLKGFLSSFFARQRELNALTDSRPAERRDHLARMLGVGRLDAAILLLKDDIKEIRQKIDILSGLQINPEIVNQQLTTKKSEIEELQDIGGKKKSEIGELDIARKEKENKLLDFRNKEERHNRIEREISVLSAQKEADAARQQKIQKELTEIAGLAVRIKNLEAGSADIERLQTKVDELKRAEALDSEKRRLVADWERLSRNIQSKIGQKADFDSRIEQLAAELRHKTELEKALTVKEAEIETLRSEYREAGSELKVIVSDLGRLEKQKVGIQELGPEAICEFCLRPFGAELPEIEKHFMQEILSLENRKQPYENKLAEIDRIGKELAKEVEGFKAQLVLLNKQERELASLESSQKAVKSTIEDNQAVIQEVEKRLSEIGEIEFDTAELVSRARELAEQKKDREEYIRLVEKTGRKDSLERESTTLKTDFEKKERQILELNAEKTAIGFDISEYKKAREELVRVQERISLTRIELERLEGKTALLEAEAKSFIEQLDNHEKSKKEISELRDRLTLLEKLSILFGDFRKYLIGRIRPALSQTTSQLFYKMTDGRYQDVELDEDYNLRLFDAGEDFPIDRFSGGEIDLANLCFRLAISIEMAKTAGIDRSFIILDEIFGSQDRRRQQLIIEGLNRLKNRFQQIIIISHIEEVKNMTDYTIEVNRDEGGISRAELVGKP